MVNKGLDRSKIVLYGGSRGLVVDIPGGGGNAKARVSIFPYFRFPKVDSSTPHTNTAALIDYEIMSHLTVNLKKFERTFLLDITARNLPYRQYLILPTT